MQLMNMYEAQKVAEGRIQDRLCEVRQAALVREAVQQGKRKVAGQRLSSALSPVGLLRAAAGWVARGFRTALQTDGPLSSSPTCNLRIQ